LELRGFNVRFSARVHINWLGRTDRI
jgi:hypothetical protein